MDRFALRTLLRLRKSRRSSAPLDVDEFDVPEGAAGEAERERYERNGRRTLESRGVGGP